MDNFKPQYMEIDLEKVIAEKDVGLIMGSGDEDANMFIVSVKRGGETVNLAGLGVVGYLIMPNDETLRIPGSVVDNKACVTIKKAGYVYDGAFQLTIKLAVGTKENTIAIFHGKNARTTSENISDGEKVIYGVKDILNMIDSMEQAEKDANNAAASANSAASKANTATTNANNATNRANAAAQELENAAIPTGTSVTYQVGTSGTTLPTGEWLNAVPTVQQGQYLWTRTLHTFTNGEPLASYSVSRFGIDGRGSVSSVCGVSPDASGNVVLDAEDVGALAVGGTAADANKLGGNLPGYYASQAQVDLLSEEIGIVCNGNQCTMAATAGQYIILKNSTISGLSDGLYKASQAIPANTAINSTYLATVSTGAVNDLKTELNNESNSIFRRGETRIDFAQNELTASITVQLDFKPSHVFCSCVGNANNTYKYAFSTDGNNVIFFVTRTATNADYWKVNWLAFR